MSHIRVCPINFFDIAALVESPAMQTTMPATNAQLTARDKSARSTGAASVTQSISGSWGGSAYIINGFFAFRHNGQGGNVRLRAWANADKTGASMDTTALALSTAITSASNDWGIPAASPDSANDLLLSEAPYSIFFTNFTAKSFQIDFTSGVRSYWDIGRIFLGKYIEAPYGGREGLTVTESYNDIQTRTKGGSLRTRAGEKWRELKVDLQYATDADRALWCDLISYVQMNSDVAISVYPGAGGRKERDHVFNMQLQAPSTFTTLINVIQTTHTFTEL